MVIIIPKTEHGIRKIQKIKIKGYWKPTANRYRWLYGTLQKGTAIEFNFELLCSRLWIKKLCS